MDMRLELVPLPSSDVDRSKEFYVERVGFTLDHDQVDDLGGVKYAYFSDPDGNSWALQEIPRHFRP